MSAELKRSDIDGNEHLISSIGGDGGGMPVDEKLYSAGLDGYESGVRAGDIAEQGVSSSDG